MKGFYALDHLCNSAGDVAVGIDEGDAASVGIVGHAGEVAARVLLRLQAIGGIVDVGGAGVLVGFPVDDYH